MFRCGHCNKTVFPVILYHTGIRAVTWVRDDRHEHNVWHMTDTYVVKETSQWWLEITLCLRTSDLDLFYTVDVNWCVHRNVYICNHYVENSWKSFSHYCSSLLWSLLWIMTSVCQQSISPRRRQTHPRKVRVYVWYIMHNLDVVRKGACISVQNLYGFNVLSNSETISHGYSVQCNSMCCKLPLHLSSHVLICTYVIALYIYLRSVLCPLSAELRMLIYTTCSEPCRRHEYVWWIAVLGWQRIRLVQNGNVIIKID